MGRVTIGGIMRNDHLALVSVLGLPDRPGVAGRIFEALGQVGTSAQLIAQCSDEQGQGQLIFCVERAQLQQARQVTEEACCHLGAGRVLVRPEVAYVAVHGPDFRERPGIAGLMFGALGREGIDILAISTSISTVSCIVELARAADAERVLRATFILPE